MQMKGLLVPGHAKKDYEVESAAASSRMIRSCNPVFVATFRNLLEEYFFLTACCLEVVTLVTRCASLWAHGRICDSEYVL